MKRDGDENLGDKHNPNDIIQASTSTPFWSRCPLSPRHASHLFLYSMGPLYIAAEQGLPKHSDINSHPAWYSK